MMNSDFLYFCPVALGFFHPIANSGAITESMTKVPIEVYSEFIGAEKHGFSLGSDENGFPAWVANPLPPNDELFNSEMSALNASYDKAMNDLSIEYNVAMARDGSTETEKVTTIRAKITALDVKYEADQAAILNKYFGE
ncbi:tail fiber assembly protein [Vibrio phage K460]